MSNQIKIKIYKKLGSELMKRGKAFLKTAFNVKLEITNSGNITRIMKARGLSRLWFADRTYYYVDLETMKSIIEYDWIDRKKYISELNDCDDYSLAFKSHLSEIYGINTVAEARHIKLYEPDTGKFINPHRANVFLAKDEGIIKAYLLEPQTDKFTEIKLGKKLVLHNQYYVLNVIDF